MWGNTAKSSSCRSGDQTGSGVLQPQCPAPSLRDHLKALEGPVLWGAGGHSHSSRLSLCSIPETRGSVTSLVLALPAPEPGLPWDSSPMFMRWSLALWKLTLMYLKIAGKSFLHAPATCIHAPRIAPAFPSLPAIDPKQCPQLQSTSLYLPPALRHALGPVPPYMVSSHLLFLSHLLARPQVPVEPTFLTSAHCHLPCMGSERYDLIISSRQHLVLAFTTY